MIFHLSPRRTRSVISVLTLLLVAVLFGGLRLASARRDFRVRDPADVTRLPPTLLSPLVAAPVLLRLLDEP